MFRELRADELECRIGTIGPKGLSLLLYKDARCDMRILDETVGPYNWKKSYSRDNANCTVSLWDATKKEWISKEDTGTESDREREKSLASDSFKRACFCWGIGRSLYTAPFIWVPKDKCTIEVKGERYVCNDRFTVSEIAYADGRITKLTVKRKNEIVFQMNEPAQLKIENSRIGKAKAVALWKHLQANGISDETVCKLYKVNELDELTERQHRDIFDHIEEIKLTEV